MKYCRKCGQQMEDDALFCPNCGTECDGTSNQNDFNNNSFDQQMNQSFYPQVQQQPKSDSGLVTAAKIFLIIATVINGIYLIPLCWCIPMTVSYFNKIKRGEQVSTAFKVCTLLFMSPIAGILMFCDNQH